MSPGNRCRGYYPHNLSCSQVSATPSTHWGRVTHICISKLTIIGSDNGLSPGRRQAIIWTNDGILLIRTFWTNFSEIVSEIHTFSFKKIHFKMSSGKWQPSCLGLNVLKIGYPQMKFTGARFSNESRWLDWKIGRGSSSRNVCQGEMTHCFSWLNTLVRKI